jgi:hypothetical protein
MNGPICRACGSTIDDDGAEKCPMCGMELRAPARIVLKWNDIRLRFHTTTDVGRNELRMFEGRQFVSSPQFRLLKNRNAWKLEGFAGTVNPTHVNGITMVGKQLVLREGDKIFVGNLKSGVGITLIVEFED